MHFVKTFSVSLLFVVLFSSFGNSQSQKQVNVKLNSSNQDETILTMNLDGFSSRKEPIDNRFFFKLISKGAYPTIEKGCPEVLQMSQSIIIPDVANTKIEIISSTYKEYTNYWLAPSKGNLTRDIDPSKVTYEFSSIYQKNAFYPGALAKLQTPYILRDFRGQSVVFYPFQYNPVTKTLRVYSSIKVKISSTSGTSENVFVRNSANTINDEEFSSFYQSHFINYNSSKYTALGESGPMLIIANQPYMSAMQPFISWKISSGRNVKMVSIQSIGNNADSIKNYINNQYITNGISFVLLVGDAQHITPKNSTSNASDNWFGYLTGNDSYPEVIVGRFSAESVADVQTQVSRSIDYELNVDTIANHYKKSVGIGSDQGPGDDNEMDYEHIQNLQTQLGNYTYNYHYQLFEGSQGGNDATGDPSPAMLSAALNDGSGIVLYTGHGSNSSFVTTGFSNSNVAALTNTNKLPFIWSVACVNGEFVGNTCFAEKWLRSQYNGNPVGAVATLMSTINQSWNPPMEGMDEMVSILTESYTSNIKRTFGALSMNGCMKMNDTYGSGGASMTDTWTIFGDPSLMVRTNTPALLTLNHAASLSLGANQMLFTSSQNGALITISKNDSILAKGVVASNFLSLSFAAINNLDSIKIVATAYNAVPYVAKIPVLALGVPFVSQTNFSINDSLTNNNQALEIKETAFLSLSLTNSGLANATNISAKVSSNSSLITVLDSMETFGNMNTGASLTSTNGFRIKAASAIVDQTIIPLNVNIGDGGTNNWNYSLPIVINAPALTMVESTITELNGNGNNLPDIGETMRVKFKVINSGHADLDSLFTSLSTSSTYVAITPVIVNTALMAIGVLKEFTFDVQIATSCPIGSSINLDFHGQYSIYSISLSKSMRVGIVDENFETGNFNKFNWQADAIFPWVIDNSIYFEGNSSAKSGLSTTDNNKTSSMTLNLKVQTADTISFYLKVSCEDGGNTYYDFLEFKTSNQSRKKWQGEVDWKREAFLINSGLQTVQWTYSKDSYFSEGDDCAWIDYIVFPPLMNEIGFEDVVNNLNIKVFPIPSEHLLTVEFQLPNTQNLEIQLLDAHGKVIKQHSLTEFASGNHQIQFEIGDLSAGVYFIKVNGTESNAWRKMIKF